MGVCRLLPRYGPAADERTGHKRRSCRLWHVACGPCARPLHLSHNHLLLAQIVVVELERGSAVASLGHADEGGRLGSSSRRFCVDRLLEPTYSHSI
jgi:hypothetical protein